MQNIPYQLRRKRIIDLLVENNFADVSSLSKTFNVSEMTIRRDLEQLERDGEIVRVYGGARLNTKKSYETTIRERIDANRAEKMAIAKVAADLIEDGDVVAFDASTTALEVSKLIKFGKKLTVVTNNLSIAIELSEAPQITVVVLGGFMRSISLSLFGSITRKSLESMYIDKAFFSSHALSFNEGLTEKAIEEGRAKQAMLEKTDRLFVMVDRSKLAKIAFYQICPAQRINVILTDELEPFSAEQEQCLKEFSESGVEVISAKN